MLDDGTFSEAMQSWCNLQSLDVRNNPCLSLNCTTLPATLTHLDCRNNRAVCDYCFKLFTCFTANEVLLYDSTHLGDLVPISSSCQNRIDKTNGGIDDLVDESISIDQSSTKNTLLTCVR